MIKVKITNGSGWYHNKVGEIFDVIENYSALSLSKNEYFIPVNMKGVIIKKSDCEVIYEPTDKEVLEFFYKDYCSMNGKHNTYQAERLMNIINKH